MKRIAAAIALTLLCGCTVSQKDIERLMKQEGITDWKDDGYAPLGCSDDDDFHSKFHGTKNGQPVTGFICGGITKGYTIRYK